MVLLYNYIILLRILLYSVIERVQEIIRYGQITGA